MIVDNEWYCVLLGEDEENLIEQTKKPLDTAKPVGLEMNVQKWFI